MFVAYAFDLMPVWFDSSVRRLTRSLFTVYTNQTTTAKKKQQRKTYANPSERHRRRKHKTVLRRKTKKQKNNNNENRSFHLISIDNERGRVSRGAFLMLFLFIGLSEWVIITNLVLMVQSSYVMLLTRCY